MSRIVCFALSVSLLGSTAFAQGDAALELYGEGVHRYFAGDLMNADQLLSRVIDSGSEDPRAYYFRGLVRERQGGGGQYDFERGAQLEAAGKRALPVGLALTRVQGSVRGQIEKARRDARVMYRQQQLLMEQARMNTPGMMAPGIVQPSGEPIPALPSETDPGEAFPGGLRSEETTEDPAASATPEVDETNPFGDDPVQDMPADPATPDSPFGDSPAPDADDMFGTPDAGAGDASTTETNPFGF